LRALDALDSRTIWAVGDNGTIIKTLDGGRTWSKQTSGITNTIVHVSAVSSDTVWASGNDCLIKSEDGGAT